ncbi:phage tail protein [Laribacter hongkongensis]|uniref:phage tail protein n=1 Tax=Laribacter hongkongensis TaxID=168471 RepID=UPI0003F7A22A|nr:phage tail protein [Laribacter hongkongensis]
MFAQLGELRFELIKHWDGLQIKEQTRFAKHEMAAGKPRLQHLGEDAVSLTIELSFHEFFCDPQTELDRLKRARVAGKALPLVWGNGLVEGDFVIDSVSITHQSNDPFGLLTSVSASVILQEFVDELPLETRKREQKDAAPARAGKGSKKKKPATTKKTGGSYKTVTEQNGDGVSWTKITRD